jgi:hypothetical protein
MAQSSLATNSLRADSGEEALAFFAFSLLDSCYPLLFLCFASSRLMAGDGARFPNEVA